MFSRRLKTGYFALEGLNSFATVYYFYYLYFFMQQVFGFGNKANLVLAALNGGTYALMAWFAGRFAQRHGYFTALKVGYTIMIMSLSFGLAVRAASGHVAVMVLTIVGMSFTWPTLEALVSEREAGTGLQHMIGVYNVVWAATAAVGNFSGGAILQKFGFASLFYVPIAIHASQLGLTFWLESKAKGWPEAGTSDLSTGAGSRRDLAAIALAECEAGSKPMAASTEEPISAALAKSTNGRARSSPNQRPESAGRGEAGPPNGGLTRSRGTTEARRAKDNQHSEEQPPIPKTRKFLQMAWLANPFAYIAINTLIAVIPGVARRLELSTMTAGFCCSTWCFARFGAFVALWQWTRWHYRFRWLLLAYLGLVGSFGAVVLAPNLAVLISAQLVFGVAVGLIYYSSLFYSMDRSETKGEHGGIHEAVIGLGNCAGPAVGAVALQLIPQHSQSGTVAVMVLLLCGLAALIRIWRGTDNDKGPVLPAGKAG